MADGYARLADAFCSSTFDVFLLAIALGSAPVSRAGAVDE